MVLVVIALLVGIGIGWALKGRQVPVAPASVEKPVVIEVLPLSSAELLNPEWYAALGGKANVRLAESIATTRIRVELLDAALLNEAVLKDLGVAAVAKIDAHTVHLIK
ncbi:PTS transporter subunit EIIB [Deefgea piscis]|uniref:PTS transporter subunit EIIB n=1 Tax=Deefgea piscis TaxID=2739061 RepID=UPI001C80EA92|nr:PTS transporter subunit EIIB [Deefgea piscis]QZA81419.1 PTS transporter subunit EIIB [Deefgea piscis]